MRHEHIHQLFIVTKGYIPQITRDKSGDPIKYTLETYAIFEHFL